jgi:hypothetical protein
MGIQTTCKGCDTGLPESAQHCLLDYAPAHQAWKAFNRVWEEWKAPNHLTISWPFILLGEAMIEQEDDPPNLHRYHIRGYSYVKQPVATLLWPSVGVKPNTWKK